jgi:beta-mannanase
MSTERLGRPIQESRDGASSYYSGDDVVDPVNLEEDDLW